MPDQTDRCDKCGYEYLLEALMIDDQGGMICWMCKARAERFAPQSNIDYEKEEVHE